jgi:hypothetical protein
VYVRTKTSSFFIIMFSFKNQVILKRVGLIAYVVFTLFFKEILFLFINFLFQNFVSCINSFLIWSIFLLIVSFKNKLLRSTLTISRSTNIRMKFVSIVSLVVLNIILATCDLWFNRIFIILQISLDSLLRHLNYPAFKARLKIH